MSFLFLFSVEKGRKKGAGLIVVVSVVVLLFVFYQERKVEGTCFLS